MMKKIISAILGLFIGVAIAVGYMAIQSPTPTVPTVPSISFRASPNVWELCQQAYGVSNPIPPEFFPKEFREYWTQNHMFYLHVGNIGDFYQCVFTRSYEGEFEITVKKKEGK